MKNFIKLWLIIGSIGMGLSFVGCGGSDSSSESCTIIGTWQSGDTKLWFYSANEGSKYIEFIGEQIFDQGTYTTSNYSACSSQMTMSSNGGGTSTSAYTIFDNNTKLNGLTDGYGNSVTYYRYTP